MSLRYVTYVYAGKIRSGRKAASCSSVPGRTIRHMDTDASLVEINPLNRNSKGEIMALDAKFNFDPNALFRHPEIVAFRDLDEEDPAEIEREIAEEEKLYGVLDAPAAPAGGAAASGDELEAEDAAEPTDDQDQPKRGRLARLRTV